MKWTNDFYRNAHAAHRYCIYINSESPAADDVQFLISHRSSLYYYTYDVDTREPTALVACT